MRKDIYILGISESHGASAALLKNGQIIGAYNEERFNRKKNYLGYPKHAVRQLLKDHRITAKKLSYVSLSFQRAIYVVTGKRTTSSIDLLYRIQLSATYRSRFLNSLYHFLYNNVYIRALNKKLYNANIARVARMLHISPDTIISFPHHRTHAASVVYGMKTGRNKVLVLTNDGAGDRYCASVSIYKNNQFKELSRTENRHSLASLYAHTTVFMGMRANEHEYKIMGLSPYTNPYQKGAQYARRLFESIHKIKGLEIVSSIDERHFQHFLDKTARHLRFDTIAYGIQTGIEEKLGQWVANAVEKTHISSVYCAGGIFMNVKANKKISEIPLVDKLTIMPSASDESTAIGAAYLGYAKYCRKKGLPAKTKPLKHLYLGNSFTGKQITTYIRKHKLDKLYSIRKVQDPEMEVAKLLAKGTIVARFSGRMEFGQRALGNRSILADPSKRDIVRMLNDQIKSRDFWMPFACTILDADETKYIHNPKNLTSYYMEMSFDTKKESRSKIAAAIHPYDFTTRPQIVTEKMNRKYYHLVKSFKKLTGIGAVLNTSFNIHGEPIVCSLSDAFRTFEKSGLSCLQLENFLIVKK